MLRVESALTPKGFTSHCPNAATERGDHVRKHLAQAVFVVLMVVLAALGCSGQNSLPFAVSNLKNLKWPVEEASRIYYSACYLAARTVRPEKPPHLRPKFILVLGTVTDETVRNGAISEIHLKKWDAANFAAAVAMTAAREIVGDQELLKIVRESLLSARAQVSVSELRRER